MSASPQLDFCPNGGSIGVGGQIFTLMIASLASYQCPLADKSRFPNDQPDSELLHEYDFIIVGSGSAGSVLAHRLSENRSNGQELWKVLLIEAGSNPSLSVTVPALGSRFINTEEDWNHEADPSPDYCLGANNQKCYLPRGKVLGGSSCVNEMMYIRGNKKDYDDWDKTLENGWDYSTMLHYFKKSQGYHGSMDGKDEGYHNTSGPLFTTLSELNEETKLTMKLFSLDDLPHIDVNGARQIGYGRHESNIYNGERYDVARAFLSPIKDRSNLHVIKKSLVTRILWNEKRAVGVTYLRNGEEKQAKASKEVILSAGTFGSPQILQLSGIGPADLLNNLNISIVQNLPVGQNLQDHFAHPAFYPVQLNDTMDLLQSTYDYLKFKKGPLAVPSMQINAHAFFHHSRSKSSRPTVQIITSILPKFTTLYLALNNTLATILNRKSQNKKTLLINTVLLRPFSRGYVYINSTNPTENIKIVPNFLKDNRDIKILLAGISRIRKMAKRLGLVGPIKILEGDQSNVEYWKRELRTIGFPIFHPVGTCKMATVDDPTGVVDPNLKVKGVTGLRVVDASVMPTIVSGNTNAPTIAIAEKASDLIKKQNNF